MTERQAFYDLPLPKRHIYTVSVQVDDTPDDTYCMEPGCTDDSSEYGLSDMNIYSCDVCKRWFCLDHINKDGFCKACAALPIGIREMVVAFREELNSL